MAASVAAFSLPRAVVSAVIAASRAVASAASALFASCAAS